MLNFSGEGDCEERTRPSLACEGIGAGELLVGRLERSGVSNGCV